MLNTFIIAAIFCGICFLVDYFSSRRWTFSDYFLIFFLVVTGMLLERIYGEKEIRDGTPGANVVEEIFRY